jgi:hypothetical protein
VARRRSAYRSFPEPDKLSISRTAARGLLSRRRRDAQVCGADDDTSTCTLIALQVTNTPPTATIDLSGAVFVNGTLTGIGKAGQAVSFSGRSTDPGSDDLSLV